MSDINTAPVLPAPRSIASLVAILAIGWALQFVVRNETPIGGIEGHVYLADSHRPLGGVRISLWPEKPGADAPHARRVVSAADGHFSLGNIPAGDYSLVASTHAHRVAESAIHVSEGRVTPLALDLQRTLPDFKAIVHQRIWGTGERARLAVRGYVDSITSLHRDTFRLHIYRTRLSGILGHEAAADALQEVGRDYDPVPRLPNTLLHPEGSAAPSTLLDREERIGDEDREGFFYHSIPLGKLSTGLYLLDLKHGAATDCAWLLVTDTALVVKRAGTQVVAFAADMKSGQPIPGATIRTYRSGRQVAQGRTDIHGLVELKAPMRESGTAGQWPITVAIHGNDEAVVDRDTGPDEAAASFAVHTYTDRPIYRPGQRIYFKSIMRRIVQRPVVSGLRPIDALTPDLGRRYAIPAGVPVAAELLDPNGDPVLRQSYRLNSYGSLNGSVDLLTEATTGVYTLKLRAAGGEYTHEVTIASYRKPEYAIEVSPDKPRYTHGETVTMTIAAHYFFGAPVAGAKVQYSVYSSPDWAAEYPDDYGYDPEEGDSPSFTHYRGDSYYGGSVTEGASTLDADGKTTVTFKAQADDDPDASPQDFIYTCHATVTEGAAQAVEGDGTARVVAGDFRLTVEPAGYVAAPGLPVEVTVTAQDHEGHYLPNVAFELDQDYDNWRDGSYHRQRVGALHGVTGESGRAVLAVTAARVGDLALTAITQDSERHRIRGRASIWVADDAGGDLDTTYTDLSLLTDRRSYTPGDTARVLINTNRVGETLLLTIEGERIYRAQTVQIDRHSTVVRVPLPIEYGPNVFLSACYVRNKHFARSDVPLRVALPSGELHVTLTEESVKRLALSVKNPAQAAQPMPMRQRSTLNVQRSTLNAARYAPGDQITYHVTATDDRGRPARCEFSLGVVDEAIYALQEDDPNALRNDFYPHRVNSVSTFYSFSAEYLGDADKSEPKITARKRFPDTAYWAPNLQTDAQGQATISFALPDSLTTWRATLTAHTLDTRIGRTVTKVIVTKPFLVRVETPRTLTQRDHSEVLAIVHNETGQPETAKVRLRTIGLTVTADAVQTIAIAAGSVGEVRWPVTADTFGTAKVTVTVWTLNGSGPQYTDGMETTLPIRAHGQETAAAFAGELTASHPENEVVRLDPDVVPGTGRLTVRITPSVAAALTGGLDYLTGYPYGCVEQTLSRMLPDLLVQRALREHGLSDVPDAPKLPQMVRESLARLYRFQHEDGAWGWWEHDADDAWMTAYVLYGLATAKRQGYPVSDRALAKGCKAGIALLRKSRLEQRPFLMYSLALNGQSAVVRTARQGFNLAPLSSEGVAYMALTDLQLGTNGAEPFALLDRRAIVRDGAVHWCGDETYYSEYGSTVATSIVLRALLAARPQDPRIEGVLRWLMRRRTGGYWDDTRDTSAVLAAFCDYLQHQSAYAASGDVEVRLNRSVVQTYSLAGTEREPGDLVLHLPATALRPGKNDVTLTRIGGTSPVFYSVELRQTVAMDQIPAQAAQGLSVTREYLKVVSRNNESGGWGLDERPTNGTLQSGDFVRVRLNIQAPRDMDYVLVEDAFPAGCEVNERGDAEDVTEWSYWWSSVDVRDDRIAYFARTLTKGKHIIEYNLRARTPGSYHALPTLVQPMYAPDIHAQGAEDEISVER